MKYSILLFGVSEQNAYAHVETELFVLEFIKNLQICKSTSPRGGGSPPSYLRGVFVGGEKGIVVKKLEKTDLGENTLHK